MALINCPECQREVSSKANSCPHCGNPIASFGETQAAGTPITTVQETGKKFKLQIAISLLLTMSGCLGLIIKSPEVDPTAESSYQIFPWMFSLGILWYLVTKIRVWWHHK